MIIVIASVIFVLAFLFSMLGLGGAMLYIPVFKWFGYDFKSVAIPTGLFLNGVTALSASVFYLRAKMVDVKGSIPMIVTSFIGAPLGAVATKYVPTKTLIILFSAGMVFAGVRMLISSGQKESEELLPFRKRALLTGAAGFFIGFIAGLLGIGGGFLFVPMMLAVGYPTKQAAATSSFIVVFSSFSGFVGHVAEGHFHLPLLVSTTVAVVVASQLGAKVMKEKMKARWIKRIFGIVLLGVALKLGWKIVF
ncbi:MAG: sulfite exporter TauE/SafE family protein [Deltaproteobacteria bacterium]|nr:MAG: sulfite exporter TauE/SafE family protein [Deltaproteobacteria bacterium]